MKGHLRFSADLEFQYLLFREPKRSKGLFGQKSLVRISAYVDLGVRKVEQQMRRLFGGGVNGLPVETENRKSIQ